MNHTKITLLCAVLVNLFINSVQEVNQSVKLKCVDKTCIANCCPENQVIKYFNQKSRYCVDWTGNKNFSKIVVYDKYLYDTKKQMKDVFDLVTPEELNMNFSLAFLLNPRRYNIYLSEDGTLTVETPNRHPGERWKKFNSSYFCIDRAQSGNKYFIGYFLHNPSPRIGLSTKPKQLVNSAAMIISCVCLALVMGVYMLLPQLRNLRGLVLMSYVGSLFVSYLVFSANLMINPSIKMCKTTSFLFYFWFLSSVFWMNIMSVDIWWTLRGYAKHRKIHRRGEIHKYLMYCAYAWGVPCAMTAGLAVLNEINMRHLPWFITPQIAQQGCFIDDMPRLLYLYLPMMVLLLSNLVFFIMSVHNIWRLSRGMTVLHSAAAAAGTRAAHMSEKKRFIVYLKLSAVMGINWILEVVSSFYPDLQIWYLTDIYNLITGVVIFIIFVCKRKIWNMLVQRLSSRMSIAKRRPRRSSMSQDTSECEHSSSGDEIPKAISYNTRGESLRR